MLLAALPRLGERALHGCGQADQVGLQHVVGRSALQRADGIFLADRAGDKDKGHVRTQFGREAQRRHAVELRHGEIREDDVGRELAQRRFEGLLALDDAVADAQARALEFAHLEFGVARDILGEQHADRGCRHADHCGTRLVSSQ